MTAGVLASINLALRAKNVGVNDLGIPQALVVITESLELSAGTDTIAKADMMFADTRPLVASATESLDLTGALLTPLRSSFATGEIIALYVKAHATNVNNVIVGGAGTNAFVGPFGAATHTYAIKPGDYFLAVSAAGWPVVDTTGDLLKIANSGGTTGVDYDIVILGRTVAA